MDGRLLEAGLAHMPLAPETRSVWCESPEKAVSTFEMGTAIYSYPQLKARPRFFKVMTRPVFSQFHSTKTLVSALRRPDHSFWCGFRVLSSYKHKTKEQLRRLVVEIAGLRAGPTLLILAERELSPAPLVHFEATGDHPWEATMRAEPENATYEVLFARRPLVRRRWSYA